MFQTFLSATMRGKKLGQFFTPRTVVEFMTELAELKVTRNPPYVPHVIDACCGTGGFLIEAMAKMTDQLKSEAHLKILTDEESRKIEETIKDESLFGIDAGTDPPIARIARMNMYLHGDGGNLIYFADSLDKKVRVEETLDPELRAERKELNKVLVKDKMRFQVALTNPPFSMIKRTSESDQKIILSDYRCRKYKDKHGKIKIRSSLKSNVMFLERYHDLLTDGGILLTVIDESVLNTQTDKPFRDWMFRNCYIRAIISLSHWSFFEAGSNVKTSILFLEKKTEPSEDQPITFYARSENIGYEKMKQDPSKSDLPQIRNAYFKFKKTGRFPQGVKKHWTDKAKFFAKKLTYGIRRMDFEWFDPRHEELNMRLEKIRREKGYKLETIGDLVSRNVCQMIKGKGADVYVSQGIPIIKVRNVTNEGINWDTDYVLRRFFDENPQSHLRPNDVLTNSTGRGSIGRVTIMNNNVECMTDGHVTTIRILDTTKILPDYLAHYLRSTFGQMQIERYTVGCTGQTELNDPDIALIKMVYPEKVSEQKRILRSALEHKKSALKSRNNYKRELEKAREEFMNALTSPS